MTDDETVLVDGVVRSWDDEAGVGVIDTDRTPGGCFAHFSAVEMDGYRKLRPGQHVRLNIEPAQNQDGYFFRATHVHPSEQT